MGLQVIVIVKSQRISRSMELTCGSVDPDSTIFRIKRLPDRDPDAEYHAFDRPSNYGIVSEIYLGNKTGNTGETEGSSVFLMNTYGIIKQK
jgi:hypothetical protein